MVTITLTRAQLLSLVDRTGGETYEQLNPKTRYHASAEYSRHAYDEAWRILTSAANRTVNEEET